MHPSLEDGGGSGGGGSSSGVETKLAENNRALAENNRALAETDMRLAACSKRRKKLKAEIADCREEVVEAAREGGVAMVGSRLSARRSL